MKKITIKDLVDFKRKETIKTRQTLINNLKKPVVDRADDDGGGDYWITSLSSIRNAYSNGNNDCILTKIEELIEKVEIADSKQTKDMFQANINILNGIEDFDFSQLKPLAELSYLKKPTDKSIITINHMPFFVKPSHVFLYDDGVKQIGAIWFVARKGGYNQDELAMVTELLYRYLRVNYSADYEVNNELCIAFDVNSGNFLTYAEIAAGVIASPLIEIVREMKRLF